MDKQALILFVRNPVLGKVKTRLAATIGNEKALAVYCHLLNQTKNITQQTGFAKYVFYSDQVTENDLWNGYEKRLQKGLNLGERIMNAFEELFNRNYQHVCIIGSDCIDLTAPVLNEAFNSLYTNEVVIGPAADGGYYLVGMQAPLKKIFDGKLWGSASVYTETLKDIGLNNLSVHILKTLNDIDEEKDINFHYEAI